MNGWCRSLLSAAALLGMASPDPATAHAQITTTVQFDREIVRVLDNHCVACHSDSGPAFPLITYEQTYRARWQMRQDALTRHMAPWAAVAGYGDFLNDNSLTQREIDFVSSWAESFGPRNDGAVYSAQVPGAALPKPVQAHADFTTWVQGAPDLLLSVPAATLDTADAGGVQLIIIDPGLRSERWLSGFEYKPADRRFVHFAVFTVQETGQWLGSWTPWHGFVDLPQGLAYHLPAGSHIAAQIHYYGTTQSFSAGGSLGFYFTQQPSSRLLAEQILTARPQASAAGGSQKRQAMTVLQEDTTLLALQPQLLPGVRSIEVSAISPDGARQVLLFARDFPLDWPTPYVFTEPVFLHKGVRLSVIEHYGPTAAVAQAGAQVRISLYQGAPLANQSPQTAPAAVAAQRFRLVGTIKSIDSAERRMVVAHGDIPGFMSRMTMRYAVGKQEDLQKLAAGDEIRADVVVNDSGSHLENIEVTRR